MKQAIVFQFSKWVLVGLLIVNLGGLAACQKKEDAPGNNGGVDGSGGMLPAWHEQGFKDWVEYDQKYYMSDIIHRLLLMQKRSPEDFEPIKALIERFIGPDQEAFRKRLANLKYTTAPTSCPASNHPYSDASISSEGVVCISYQGFKNIPLKNMIPKAIAMTIHEIAHLQGFNEEDATKMQNLFDEGSYGKTLNLFFNDYYMHTHKTWNHIAKNLGEALRALTFAGSDSKSRACQNVAISQDRRIDFALYESYLPPYIMTEMSRNVLNPLLDLHIGCLGSPEKEIADKLATILKAVGPIETQLREFESPFCSPKTCARRSESIVTESLDRWELIGDKSINGSQLAETDLNKLSCQVKDLTTQTLVPFKRTSTYSFEIQDDKSDYKVISPILLSEIHSVAEVELWHLNRPIEVLGETSAFNDGSMLRGYLAPGKREKFTVRFNLLKENVLKSQVSWDGEYVRDTSDAEFVSLFMYDPYFFPRKRLPAIETEFELTCEFIP